MARQNNNDETIAERSPLNPPESAVEHIVDDIAPRFTAQQRRDIGSYFRRIWDYLGLEAYVIRLVHEPPPADCNAQVEVVQGRHIVKLWLSDDFYDQQASDIRNTVLHEGVHVMMVNITDPVRIDLLKWVGQQMYEVFYDNFKRHVELFVDKVSSTWDKDFPLPPWKGQSNGDDPAPTVPESQSDSTCAEAAAGDERPGTNRC